MMLDLVLLRSEWQGNEKTFAECTPEMALEEWTAALAPLLEDEMLKRVVSDNYALRKLVLEYHVEQGRWLDALEGEL